MLDTLTLRSIPLHRRRDGSVVYFLVYVRRIKCRCWWVWRSFPIWQYLLPGNKLILNRDMAMFEDHDTYIDCIQTNNSSDRLHYARVSDCKTLRTKTCYSCIGLNLTEHLVRWFSGDKNITECDDFFQPVHERIHNKMIDFHNISNTNLQAAFKKTR